MKNIFRILSSILPAIVLAGCGHAPRQHIYMLPDMSASITPASQKCMLSAMYTVASRCRRGDAVTFIPILSDEAMDAPGEVKTFDFVKIRQNYGRDLIREHKAIHDYLCSLFRMMAKPGMNTDILGAERVAEEQMRAGSRKRKPLLIVLSDGVEDAGGVNFANSPELQNRRQADNLAQKLAASSGAPPIKGIPVIFAFLGSKDLKGASQNRRDAVMGFWHEFFSRRGFIVHEYMDGPDFLMSQQSLATR